MPMGESISYLAKSRYVRDLATLVVAYGISINLVEVTWKSKIKAQYPNPNDYSAFMGCVLHHRVCAAHMCCAVYVACTRSGIIIGNNSLWRPAVCKRSHLPRPNVLTVLVSLRSSPQ